MYILSENRERIDDLSRVEELIRDGISFSLVDVEIFQNSMARLSELMQSAGKKFHIHIDYGYCTDHVCKVIAWMILFAPITFFAVSLLWKWLHFNPDYFLAVLFMVYSSLMGLLWWYYYHQCFDYKVIIHLPKMIIEVKKI